MVLIYTKHVDDFVNQVIDCLEVDYIRIGDRDTLFIEKIVINDNVDFNIKSTCFHSVNLSQIRAIWFNGGGVNCGNSLYENQCYQTLIDSFLTNLSVNKIGRLYNEYETNKLYASFKAQEQGFKVPDTLITGNKLKLEKFYSKYNTLNGVVCKRIVDSHFYKNNEYTYNFINTFLIDSKILDNIPKKFAISLFQERILAEFEVRVVYIKGSFYAMSIHVFDDEVDCRKNLNSLKNVRTTPFSLPKDVKVQLENVFINLKLNYGSADLMYYKNEFYFLEINPAGQISYVNEACNFYIEEEFSKMLKNER